MRRRPVWYWIVAAALVTFGVLGILSIGLPALVAGAIMIVGGVSDWDRRRPRIFWPVVAAIAAFFVGFILVAPATCRTTVATGQRPITECRNPVGLTYRGDDTYAPPVWPGLATGAVAALGRRGWSLFSVPATRDRTRGGFPPRQDEQNRAVMSKGP